MKCFSFYLYYDFDSYSMLNHVLHHVWVGMCKINDVWNEQEISSCRCNLFQSIKTLVFRFSQHSRSTYISIWRKHSFYLLQEMIMKEFKFNSTVAFQKEIQLYNWLLQHSNVWSDIKGSFVSHWRNKNKNSFSHNI